MDRGQTRLLLILSAMVIAVAAALYLGKDHEEPSDPDATEAVWSIDPTTASKVVVERAAGSMTLEKRGDDWFVLNPADRADRDQVNDLLDTLKQMKLGIPVPGAADHAADFGLGDPPSARVTLTLADGTEHALDVGVVAPIGFRTYVKAADGAIVAVNGDLDRPLQAEVGRYRDHHVVQFDAAQVRDVRITSPDGVLHVHGEGKDWFLDGFGRADPDHVDDLVVGLLDLRYDELSGPDDPGVVDPPLVDAQITLADGSSAWLKTGQQVPQGVVVAGSDGRGGIVTPDALKQLGRGPNDLALRQVFGISLDETETVKISAGGKSIEARRNGSDWHSDGADDASTYEWVASLAHVQSELRRDAPPMPSPVELTVEGGEGERHWKVEVGPKLSEGDYRAVHDAAADAAVRIPAGAVEDALDALK